MYKGLVNALYLMNIIFQSFLNLLTPVGLGLLISYLLTVYANAPSWIYVPTTVFGVFVGLFSMVKFILSAMKTLEQLENEQKLRDTKFKEARTDDNNEKGISFNEE